MIKTTEGDDIFYLSYRSYNTYDYVIKLSVDNNLEINESVKNEKVLLIENEKIFRGQSPLRVQNIEPEEYFNINSTEKQTLIDISLMGYTSLDRIIKLAVDNNYNNINDTNISQRKFSIEKSFVKDKILSDSIRSKKVAYCTGYNSDVLVLATENYYAITTENGYMIIIT